MTQHKKEVCINESRIVKLEQKVKQSQKQQEETNDYLKELNKSIQTLTETIIAIQTTFNTLKWIVGVLIALFGGFFVFLLSELTKLI